MLGTDGTIVRITVGWDMSDEESEELAQALDDAGIDAVIEPVPGRMGLPGVDLVALSVEASLGVLATAVLTAAGHRVWTRLTTMLRSRRGSSDAGSETALVVHDPQVQVRVDLTLDDLDDERLAAGIAELHEIRTTGAPMVLRWDRATSRFHVHTGS